MPESLEAELARARDLSVDRLADAVESIGFECTRCGACCKGSEACGDDADGADDADDEVHTATVTPDEVRRLRAAATDGEDPALDGRYDWRDVARPTPFGLSEGPDGEPAGETFEWALAVDGCGDCAFYAESEGEDEGEGEAGTGRCTVHEARPLICRTYPFSVALAGSEPAGGVVEREGPVRAHECEGLGRDISRADAEKLARALRERAIRDLEEAIAVRDAHEPVDPAPGETVIHDSEGQKRPDGRPRRPDRR